MKKFYFLTLVAGISVAMSADYLYTTTENVRLRKQLFEQQRALEILQQGLPARRQRLQEVQSLSGKSASVAETVGKAVALDVESAAVRSNDSRLFSLLSKYRIQSGLPQSTGIPQSPGALKGGR
jgi:hypothetical protein